MLPLQYWSIYIFEGVGGLDLKKLCEIFDTLYGSIQVECKPKRKRRVKKYAKISINSDGSLLYEGTYKKKRFSVLIPNSVHNIDEQFSKLFEVTWGAAHEFLTKYVVPNMDEVREKLHENGNVVIKFLSPSTKSRPVIYSEIPKSEFESLLEEIESSEEVVE